MIVELIVNFVDAILLDCDVPKSDDERFNGFDGRIIVVYRFGKRTGHGRRSRSVRILLIFLHPTL